MKILRHFTLKWSSVFVILIIVSIYGNVLSFNEEIPKAFSKSYNEINQLFDSVIASISECYKIVHTGQAGRVFNSDGTVVSDIIKYWNGIIRSALHRVSEKLEIREFSFKKIKSDYDNDVDIILQRVTDHIDAIHTAKEYSCDLQEKNYKQTWNYFEVLLDTVLDVQPTLLDRLIKIYDELIMKESNISQYKRQVFTASLVNEYYEDGFDNCNNFRPVQKIFYDLYSTVLITEINGMIAIIHAFGIETMLGFENNFEMLYTIKNSSMKRIHDYTSATHRSMAHFSTIVQHCDAVEWIRDSSFIEMENHVRNLYVNEANFNQNCQYGCQASNYSRYNLSTDIQITKCFNIDLTAHICFSAPWSSRTLEFIQDGRGNHYGRSEQKSCVHKEALLIHKNDPCGACICEAIQPQKICVEAQTATIQTNMIVTAVRIAKNNNIIHLEIQEGLLQGEGNVQQNNEWNTIEHCDFLEVFDLKKCHWMYLDDVILPPGFVVTGISFKRNSVGDSIKFLVQGTEYNYFTGKLNLKNIKWFDPERFLDLNYRPNVGPNMTAEDSRLANINVPINIPSTYVEFTHTNFQTDLGQMTIPLFDAQPVRTIPAVPLRGVGLFYKGSKGYGGFIAPRIFVDDLEEYL